MDSCDCHSTHFAFLYAGKWSLINYYCFMYEQLATKPKEYTKVTTVKKKHKYKHKTKLNNSNVEREDKYSPNIKRFLLLCSACHSYQRHNQPRSRQSNINVQAVSCGAIGRSSDQCQWNATL